MDRALGEAFRAVMRQEIRDALSQITMSTADTAIMVSVAEAARLLGIGKTKLNELIASRELPSGMVDRRRLLRTLDLEAWAAALVNGK